MWEKIKEWKNKNKKQIIIIFSTSLVLSVLYIVYMMYEKKEVTIGTFLFILFLLIISMLFLAKQAKNGYNISKKVINFFLFKRKGNKKNRKQENEHIKITSVKKTERKGEKKHENKQHLRGTNRATKRRTEDD